MKKFLMLLFIGLFLFSLVSAEKEGGLLIGKQYDSISLPQECASCSYVYLTSIQYPNMSRIYINSAMSIDGSSFNYIFSDTIQSGTYNYCFVGDVDGTNTSKCNDFEINRIGKEMDGSKSSLYIFIMIIAIVIFFGLLTLGIFLPYSNKKDEITGYIIATRNVKYLKVVFIGLAYIDALFISYFSWMVTYAYLDMPFVSNIFQFMFYFMAILTLPLFILLTYLLIANAVRDTKIKDMLERGLRVE